MFLDKVQNFEDDEICFSTKTTIIQPTANSVRAVVLSKINQVISSLEVQAC